MNKRQILSSLANIADNFDKASLYKEANILTRVMKRIADEYNIESDPISTNNIPEESNNLQQNNTQPFISFVLDEDIITKTEGFSIGRQGDVVTPPEINTVSRKHCFITLNRHGKWAVYDLDSKAGTTLNDEKLSPRVGQELKINDAIRLDPYVLIEITDMYP
jgi:pSer/pThr/pTyr-binding forkhead associated (FHA) protein